jgi:glycopeptide antibiotics resistance protein
MEQYLTHFAFFFLAALILAPFKKTNKLTIAVLLLAAGSEIVQIWIPYRVFDWRDMQMNFLGIAAGWSLRILFDECYPVFKRYYRRKKYVNQKNNKGVPEL